jgi:hypothetical protein
MFGLLSGTKKANGGVYVTARLNARLQPMDRGGIYEDPLNRALRAAQLGEVTGGGTQLAEEGGIEFCDLEIVVREADAPTLATIASLLETFGAPKGSKLIVDRTGEELPFGRCEGLAVHINGVDLDEEVYRTCDVNHVIAEFDRLMDGMGHCHSYWQGPRETALYLYGKDAEMMRERIAPFISSYPLCEKARVEPVA